MRGYVQGSGLHARLVVAAPRRAHGRALLCAARLRPAGRARVLRTHVSVQVCRTSFTRTTFSPFISLLSFTTMRATNLNRTPSVVKRLVLLTPGTDPPLHCHVTSTDPRPQLAALGWSLREREQKQQKTSMSAWTFHHGARRLAGPGHHPPINPSRSGSSCDSFKRRVPTAATARPENNAPTAATRRRSRRSPQRFDLGFDRFFLPPALAPVAVTTYPP
jgi:hypothetical protein